MSDGLRAHPASPELLDAQPETAPRSAWLVVPAQALATVVIFAAGGAAAGWLWYKLWDVPSGVVSGGQWYTGEAGLRDVLGTHPGVTEVRLRLLTRDATKVMRLDDRLRVTPSPALFADLKQLLGPGCLTG